MEESGNEKVRVSRLKPGKGLKGIKLVTSPH
jgi:hypothetical protein